MRPWVCQIDCGDKMASFIWTKLEEFCTMDNLLKNPLGLQGDHQTNSGDPVGRGVAFLGVGEFPIFGAKAR